MMRKGKFGRIYLRDADLYSGEYRDVDLTDGLKSVEHMGASSTPANAVAAQSTLTVGEQPGVSESIKIGGQMYYTVITAGNEGEVAIGADLAGFQANIVAAINGDAKNTANASVTIAAFAGNDAVMTASLPGEEGNSIKLVNRFDNKVANYFDAPSGYHTLFGQTTAGVWGDAGKAGHLRWDADNLYICTQDQSIYETTNYWKKTALVAA